MNGKNIKKHLNNKLRDWISNIDDENIKKILKENVIVTGGAIVSLLTDETLHDYDVYFRTKEACLAVATYYVGRWNGLHPDKPVSIRCNDETGKIDCFVSSKGIADEDEENTSNISYNFASTEDEIDEALDEESESEDKEKYRPRFITSNAITLTDKVQIVIRFYGEVEEIHKNYDFELYYIGSKYPLCSIIRTRKYLERGYHINAGQYVKMCMQLNELDLKDVKVLEDQLTGVDTTYFRIMVDALQSHMESTGEKTVDTTYAMNLINKLF